MRINTASTHSQKGFSALHAAVHSGNKNVIQALIDNGANVNLQSRVRQSKKC